MSQLKKIKFSSIDDFKNAASNGELNNETIWITPDEEPDAEIAITNVTSLLQAFDSDGKAIFAPDITPSEVIRISNITKPQFIYVDATNVTHVVGMYIVAGVRPNYQICVIYEYNSKLYKLTYDDKLGFISAVSLDSGSSNSSKMYKYACSIRDYESENIKDVNFVFYAEELITNRDDFEAYISEYALKTNYVYCNFAIGTYDTIGAYQLVRIVTYKNGGIPRLYAQTRSDDEGMDLFDRTTFPNFEIEIFNK